MKIAVCELRVVREEREFYGINDSVIKNPLGAAIAVNEVYELNQQPEEMFVAFYFSTKHKIEACHIISKGSLNASIVHPREVFKPALLHNASAVMVFHNHPSGDPTPSQEDVNITKRLKEAGELLGISLLDHIIIAGSLHHSLREGGDTEF